jgi:hypothetical protein
VCSVVDRCVCSLADTKMMVAAPAMVAAPTVVMQQQQYPEK